jgi:hypothetical protein
MSPYNRWRILAQDRLVGVHAWLHSRTCRHPPGVCRKWWLHL